MSIRSYSPKKVKWSLRKIRLPITNNDLVLDVGSGGNPHPAADILLEKYSDDIHRFTPLVFDRPMVLADACKMPFKNKAFDYVIAFHVLEHIDTPELFLEEIQRVGKAGYIETPNAIFERLVPYNVHVLEIMDLEGELIINKKISEKPDKYFGEMEIIRHSKKWNKFFYNNPEYFHVRYFWRDKIKFRIINPEADVGWINNLKTSLIIDTNTSYQIINFRRYGMKLVRRYYKMKKKRKINLLDILACPQCLGEFINEKDFLICLNCKIKFQKSPIPDFNRTLQL